MSVGVLSFEKVKVQFPEHAKKNSKVTDREQSKRKLSVFERERRRGKEARFNEGIGVLACLDKKKVI